MTGYHCDYCGVYFRTPAVTHHHENLGEFSRTYTTQACPICGCDSFSETADCPKCGEPMPPEDRLCSHCRTDLKTRLITFADSLTAEEEEQLDDWLDGDSITNRKEWN